jgi:hypothetical protein
MATYGNILYPNYDGYSVPFERFIILNIAVPKIKVTKMQCAFSMGSEYYGRKATAYCFIADSLGNLKGYTNGVDNKTETLSLYDLPIAYNGVGDPATSVILEAGNYRLGVRVCCNNDNMKIGCIWGYPVGTGAHLTLGACAGFDTSNVYADGHLYTIALVGDLIAGKVPLMDGFVFVEALKRKRERKKITNPLNMPPLLLKRF